ncbi:MAG: DUF308 domain-containing protein [Cyanobacteriota bacterium]|nr:DUF308 domain-containing protein [Cyanobacteriota bacterium]
MAFDPREASAHPPADPSLPREESALRTFTLAEGIMMLVLGTLSLIFPLVASVWVTAAVALVLLIGGLISWINTMARARQLDAVHTFWRLVVATLLVVTGLWMVTRLASGPTAAARQLTILARAIGGVFLIEGAVATCVSLTNRHVRGWGWGLVNGLMTLLLGGVILMMKNHDLARILGTLVGISFLFSGIDMLGFSAGFHSKNYDLSRGYRFK